ncbi:MAG: SDR family oxidoreductase [Phycisphaeraceae bacterium]|nr:SDR family oxidoreductase [Phycisphaeraceae bacterium]
MTWLITGANRGIGLEMARQLRERGDVVVGTARDPGDAEALEAVAERVIKLDVSSEASIEWAAMELGEMPLDALVNNAGSPPVKGSITELDLAEFEAAMAIHALGPLRVTRAVLPNLRRGSGKLIVTISSELGSNEIAQGSLYYGYKMGKAAANMFTSTLGTDLKSEGFTCLAMHPGWVSTRMGGEQAPVTPEESVSAMLKALGGLGPGDSGSFVDRFGEGLAY